MVNSVTGNGTLTPNLTAGDGYDSVGGGTGTAYVDTGPLTVDYIVSGRYGGGTGATDGTITVTGVGADVIVDDNGLYAYSRIIVAQGFATYTSTGVLDVLDGATITSTNNAAVASGSIPLGGYTNLLIGVDGESANGTVTVSGAPGGQRSSLILDGGSAGFVMGGDGGTGSLTIDNGAYFRTLTGVIGQGNTGSPNLGGMGTVTVDGTGSEFKASTLSGEFLVNTDQAPIIYVGQNDGSGYLNADNDGLITIQNEVGDGKSSPTLIFGDDPGSFGDGNILGGAELRITQYGPASGGNRLNGDSGLIIGNGGRGNLDVLGYDGADVSEVSVLGDRANLVISRGSYDGQGAPVAPGGQSLLSVYFRGQVTIDSQTYGNQGGATATVGAGRLSDGYLQVGSYGIFTVRSDTDIAGDQTTGKITIGDVGNGELRVGSFGSVYGRELVIGARGYTANALDNSTDQLFEGYNAAPDGGGTGVATVNSGSSKIVITATDNTPDRGITIGQASGATGTLNIDYANSYVRSTGGLGQIVIGEYGTGTVNVTDRAALYGGFITVGVGTTAAVDTLSISGVDSRVVASGVDTNILFGGVSNGQSAVVEVGRQDGSYGRLVINNGGALEITNDAGNDQNPTLLIATQDDSYGRVQVDGAGSVINITQNGARFLAPSGDTFGGAEAIIGKVGYANVDLDDGAQINVLGDSAFLSVGDGGYDAIGDPIISSVQSNLTISGGSAVLVDSQIYGFDDTASGYSTGASVYIGRGIGGNGRITVAGTPGGYDSSLTVTSSSDFVNDYVTGGIVVGDLGMGELRVQGAASGFGVDTTDVTARSLTVGQSSFYDDGSGRQYGGYLPVVTAAGVGAVTLTGASSVVLTATENTPDRGLTIGRDSGTVGVVTVNTYGSITSQGGEGKIVVGEFGDGTLTLNNGAGVTGFSMEIGIGEGSNGDVVVDGYDMLAGAFSQITLSNQFGDFSGDPEDNGQAGNLRIGVEDGSDGSLTINGGGIVNVINQNGTTYEAPTVQLGSENGAVGTLTVDGYYGGGGSFFYPSQLNITQTGNVGDFVATGGVGPIGPQLIVGQGGQGLATASNQGQIVISGAAARLFVASGGVDGAGNPDTTTDRSDLEIRSGAIVTVDSQSYGGTQTFTDAMGNPVTASLGAQVVVGGGEGATGLITLDDAGSALLVTSADESAGDYETGRITFGRDGGTGTLLALSNSTVQARGLSLGIGENSVGSATLFGGDVIITGTDATRYQGIQIGRDGGVATVTVRTVSELTSTGGAGRLQVGREADGQLNINTGGTVNAFFMDVGRGAGSNGGVDLDGTGSRLTLSDAFGQFDPAVATGPRGGNLTVGREDGGNGDITVSDGASLNVINDDMAAPAVQANGATLTIGRDTGAVGQVTVTGVDGMGNASYLRVQNYGRSNDGPTEGEYYGPELRLGRDGGAGQLTIELGGEVGIVGEAARVIIGEGTEGGDFTTEPTSLLSVTSGGDLLVDSIPNPDYSLPYNAAARIVIGEETGGNGRLLVTGTGSTVTIQSDNAGDRYANGDLAFGAGLTVGALGFGVLDVFDGGQIVIDGLDDIYPNLRIGYGQEGATVGALGIATVTGAGSSIQIVGGRSDIDGILTNGVGGLIEIGVNDGTSGRLTISDGGSVQNSAIFGKTQIAREVGSTGDVTATGAGSTFDAGDILTVGAYETGNTIVTDQSGLGTLTITDQAVVSAASTIIGNSGTLSITNATLSGAVAVSGDFQVGGLNTEGNATILGSLTQTSGLIEFDVNGSSYDQLEADSATFSGSAITIDVVDASTFTVGDSFTLFMTTGSLAIDSTETINFVGENAMAGQQFTVVQDADPFGGQTVEMLNFVVEQTTLATVAGDLKIISEALGQVALTTADLNVVEGGVAPALQTLTVTSIFGGQLESALVPGVAVTTFSQQDVDERLIRFVSDGSQGAFVELGFTDSAGFADSVIVNVVSPGVPDFSLASPPNGAAITIDGVTLGAYFGYAVSGAGDINGDGIDDLIVGAKFEDGVVSGTGAAFVIFGSTTPFPDSFDLTSIDGTNGFVILGENTGGYTGFAVTGVGDVNGDGLDDLAVASPYNTALGAPSAGEVHVIFGDSAPFDPTLSLATLSPADGLTISGSAPALMLGADVAGGQDFNGDGVADIAVSGTTEAFTGDVFVIFGDGGGLSSFETDDLDGVNGFRATGLASSEFLGSSLSMADIDGDGLSDLVIGASGAQSGYGSVFVIKGAANSAATVDVTTLSGADGFRIDGLAASDALGTSVSSAGDFNGDGVEDIVVAASGATVAGQGDTGSVYVIFGVENGFNDATFSLTSLDGTNGFQIDGRDFGDNFGKSVSSVGDMNGDGFGDILIGAPNADPQGMISGEAYLIFGSDVGFAAQQNITALTDDQLALITDFDPLDSAGFATGGGFDLNGDGADDAIIGGPNAGGMDEGAALVVFGVLAPLIPVIEGDLQIEADQGQPGLITTTDLVAFEPDADPADLLYHVTNPIGGFVAALNAPGVAISTFTQLNIEAGQVVFTKDATTELGSFDVTVTDRDGDVADLVTVAVQTNVGANSFNLSDLDGTNGFQLNGIAPTDQSGLSVSSAGDINGDGFDDVIVGAQQANGGGINDSGETYVVFGAAGGFAAQIELSSLDGTNGFRLTGTGAVDLSGGTVSAAGDINNDGIDDLLVGIRNADRPSFNEGEVVVIYGSTTPFPPTRALTGFDGTDGTSIIGADTNSLTGASLSEAGDINGDGIDDFIIGSPFADSAAGNDAGESFVVFGVDGGLGASFNLTTLDGSNGFRIDGPTPGFLVGLVGGIGDINDDGFNDIAVGSQVADPASGADAGITYVVFGGPTVDPIVNVGALDGTNGFRLDGLVAGDQSGRSLSAAGDINNDGVDDFLIGAFATDPNGVSNAGSVYVVFGEAGGPAAGAATFDLASLDGTNGFEIQGVDANDRVGYSVSNIGDFNGDGISDILISADAGDPFDLPGAGEAYIVFGQEGGFNATLRLADLDGTNGLRLNGIDAGDSTGRSVSGAGDVNNDGRDDIIIGAFNADPDGLTSAGQSYVVFGFGPNQPPIARDDAFDVIADVPVSGDLFADNGDDIDEDVDGDPFVLISVNGNSMQVGTPFTLPSGASLLVGSDGLFDYATNGEFDILAEGELAADTFTYTIGNAAGEQSTATVNLTIIGVNDAPFAFDDNLTVSEDDDLVGNLFDDNGFGIDLDIDNGSVIEVLTINNSRFSIGQPVTLTGGGQITLEDDGTFQFSTNNAYEALADGETITETFTYTIIDEFGGTATAGVNLDVTGVNDAPVAQDDSFLTDEDTAFSGDLFANNGAGADLDIDSPAFTVTAVNGDAANVGATITLGGLAGALTVRADGTFDYAPSDGADVLAEGDLGAEVFTYQITDDLGAVSTANVIITLNGLNDTPVAFDDALSVSEDDNLTGSLFDDNGFGADFDIDNGAAFTVVTVNGFRTTVGQPVTLSGGGEVTVNDDGTFSFATNNAYETLAQGSATTETFIYTITDGLSGNSTATVNLDIIGANDAPMALDDDVSINEGSIATLNVIDDNGNGVDFDIDNDQFRVVSANGQAIAAGGSINFFTTEGLAVTINNTGALMLNSSSPALDVLGDGEQLTDSFIYVLQDEFGLTDTAQVNVTINGVNDAPVANDDQFTVLADEILVFDPIAGGGAGGQDTDPEGATLTVVTINGQEFSPGDVIALPSGANIAVSLTGALEYQPSGAFDTLGANQSGQESFAYEIEDAGGLRSNGLIQIRVDAPDIPPVAADDAVVVAEDGPTSIDLFADNGAGADQNFSDNGIRLTGINGNVVPNATAVTLTSGIVLNVSNTGLISFDPGDLFAALSEGETATETFSYTITDSAGLQDEGDVTVSIIGANDAPIAANDFLRTDERTAISANIFADNGGGTDGDLDNDFTVTAINGDNALVGTEITLPSGALLTINADGSANFDPNGVFFSLNDGEQGSGQLTYTITDDQGATDDATIVFAVDGITDTIFGSDGNDLIRGTDQADDIDGRGGNDLITGLEGNDTLKGGQGLDIIRGGDDDDILIGGADKDRLFGEAGNDRLDGGGGNDRLLGLAGNDTLNGNDGNDLVSGGRGNDLVSGQDGDDRLRGGRDSDTLIAGDGKDRLQGGTGNDRLFGEAGNDNLTGAGGADTLSGGDGIDRLFGRRGSDELTGGQGSDRFIFNLGDGSDTITDFEQGTDLIRIASGVESFADLTITQVGDDALITFGNVRILALDEDENDFTSSDFIL